MTGRPGQVQGPPLRERPKPRRLCERPEDGVHGCGTNAWGCPLAVLMVLTLVATVSEATAQGRVSLSGYWFLGEVRQNAAQRFEAVSDARHAQVLGAGVEITNLWRFVFVDVAISRLAIDGERLSIDDGAVQTPGIPREVSPLYVDVAAGWRHSHGRLSAYVGRGVSRLEYRETSEFTQSRECVTESGTARCFSLGLMLLCLDGSVSVASRATDG
jgi:hypothetical protein